MIPQTHKNLIEIYLFKHYIELVYESRFLFLIEMNSLCNLFVSDAISLRGFNL